MNTAPGKGVERIREKWVEEALCRGGKASIMRMKEIVSALQQGE